MNQRPQIEEWKDIPDFESYRISNWGRLQLKLLIDSDFVGQGGRKLDGTPKLKKPKISKAKSDNICLRRDGQSFWFKRAQLVLLAFVGPPKSKQEWNARHLNDNPEQNWVTNLAWGTHKDNHADGVRNGRHARSGSAEAQRYVSNPKGVPRTEEVKRKISATKKAFPERQHYAREKGPDGRFTR